MSLTDEAMLLAIGCAAGILGGLLGIGGSILMIPAMHLIFGPAQHLYQGAAMMVNFFIVLPAAIQHRRAGAVLYRVVRVTIPSAAVAVLAGAWTSSGPWFRGPNEVYLSRLFGAFLLYVAVYNVFLLVRRRPTQSLDDRAFQAIPTWKIALIVGVPTGFFGGLLGIGGGILAVPFQQLFLKIPLRRAIGNSAATIVLMSLIGATFKNYLNAQAGIPFVAALKLALFLFPTAMIGSFVGSRLTHTLPRPALRIAVILLMIYCGFVLLNRPSHKPSPTNANKSVRLGHTPSMPL